MNKVGAEAHVKELKNLKNTSRNDYIKIIRKNGDEFIDNDLLEFFEDDSSSTNSIFKKVIILNWIGKIYNNSDYLRKLHNIHFSVDEIYPKKNILSLSNISDITKERVFLVNIE